jgi:hypothetical protein
MTVDFPINDTIVQLEVIAHGRHIERYCVPCPVPAAFRPRSLVAVNDLDACCDQGIIERFQVLANHGTILPSH